MVGHVRFLAVVMVTALAAARTSAVAAEPGPLAVVPLRFANGHAYLDVRINGRGPFAFLLDTGASGVVITARAAEVLHIRGSGSFTGGGGGGATVHYTRATLRELRVGGVVLRRIDAVISPQTFTYFPVVEGVRCDGVLGYDLFRRYAVQIDPRANRLTLWRFGTFDTRPFGAPIPFRLGDYQVPVVSGTIDGVPGELWIDTGFRGTALVFSPFVRAHRLDARPGTSFEAVASWGVGGPVRAQLRRADLTVAGRRFSGAILQLSHAASGADASRDGAGLVGAGILRRFAVTFDYSRKIMYVRTGDPAPFHDTWDRLGAWINAGDRGFVVVDVVRGGPAHRAGIVAGDVVTAVDGRSWRGLSLSDARARFRRQDAFATNLTVQRHGTVRRVRVKLRDLI